MTQLRESRAQHRTLYHRRIALLILCALPEQLYDRLSGNHLADLGNDPSGHEPNTFCGIGPTAIIVQISEGRLKRRRPYTLRKYRADGLVVLQNR